MKRAVSLSQLLNGNSIKKKKCKNEEAEEILTKDNCIDLDDRINNDSTVESISLLDETNSSPIKVTDMSITSKPTRIVPSGDRVSNDSIKNFLMQKKPKEKHQSNSKSTKPIIISLEDNTDVDNRKVDIDDKFENITNPKRLTGILNAKKTNLKNLFNNFRKPICDNSNDKENNDNSNSYSNYNYDNNTKLKRLNEVSKLKELETPFPKKQKIEPKDDLLDNTNKDANFTHLYAIRDNDLCVDQEIKANDYEILKSARNEHNQTNQNFKYSIQHNKHFSLWTKLFEPKSINDVMLETKLKRAVEKWITQSFIRLKKPTSRNKLIKSYKQQQELSEFEDFIVPDDIENDTENQSLEEFVPLMILHGEGIGKNTLISTIVQSLDAQILEINSSQNRSKKILLETLTEYCTSHYVKDKSSGGIVLLDDVDVLFKEHDKGFWTMIETILLKSRKPIIMTCRDVNFIPTNLINICTMEESIFEAKKVSTKTVVTFLSKYCDILGLKFDNDNHFNELETIVKLNNKDIRKCLLYMQLWFSCGNQLSISTSNMESVKPKNNIMNLTEYTNLLEIVSLGDIIENSTQFKSLILDEKDKTLQSTEKEFIFNAITDDQLRLIEDYLVDYRIYLLDDKRIPLLPFEVNIGKELNSELKHEYDDILHLSNYPKPVMTGKKFQKMQNTSMHFIKSRIKQHLSPMRKTRNSRKIQEILQRFEGNNEYEINDEDNTVECEFVTITKRNLSETLNPYILELAKYDSLAKDHNKKIFTEYAKNVPEEEYPAIVRDLSSNGHFKTVRFHADPKEVLKQWE